jgi:uncharacterized protein (DUF362 family)
MNRRKFIKTGISAGIITGATFLPFKILKANFSQPENIVMVQGGAPPERFRKGIDFLGGIRQFVKKGQRVVVKPAMAYDKTPESGFTTNPFLIKEIIDQCYKAGAKAVSVFDHTVDPWTKCYKNSGIERIAKDAMARVIPANNEMYYTEIKSDKPQILKSVKIHKAILEADVFINVPVIGYGKESRLSVAMANLLGCVWGKEFFINNGYDHCLAELLFYLKPDLNLIDAGLVRSAANQAKPFSQDTLIFSTDIVAADSLACQLIQINPDELEYLKIAEESGFGNTSRKISDINKIRINS